MTLMFNIPASASSANEIFFGKGREGKAAVPLFPPYPQKPKIQFPEPAEG
jgi:hypothetical protein